MNELKQNGVGQELDHVVTATAICQWCRR